MGFEVPIIRHTLFLSRVLEVPTIIGVAVRVTSRWLRLFEMIQKHREYYIPPYPTFCSNFSRGTSGIHAEP